jgi:hypothetical protein
MYLSVDTPRGKQSGLNGIKVQSTNGSGVRGILEYESLRSAVVIMSLLPLQRLERHTLHGPRFLKGPRYQAHHFPYLPRSRLQGDYHLPCPRRYD